MEETKANFMTIASHMLRTPISGVRWSLEALTDDKDGLDEEQQELLANAYESSIHLTEFLNSILRTTSYDVGVSDLQMEVQILCPILSGIIANFKESIKARTVEQIGDNVLIHIHNNGRVIAPEEQSQIFKKFFRGKEGLQAQPDGTGLGLYTAKTIIHMLGGALTFTSAPEQGTTFTVQLPVAEK